jgi:hypothetical protein
VGTITDEVYFSTDVETNGPTPGFNSMLSLGCAAFTVKKGMVGTFEANLKLLPNSHIDARTMDFWDNNLDAYMRATKDPRDPKEVIEQYVGWVNSLSKKPVFAGYPTGFDFTFVYWYCNTFVGYSPFKYRALDIRSLAMGVMGKTFHGSGKEHMPPEWLTRSRVRHDALEDAISQGQLLMNILKARRDRG